MRWVNLKYRDNHVASRLRCFSIVPSYLLNFSCCSNSFEGYDSVPFVEIVKSVRDIRVVRVRWQEITGWLHDLKICSHSKKESGISKLRAVWLSSPLPLIFTSTLAILFLFMNYLWFLLLNRLLFASVPLSHHGSFTQKMHLHVDPYPFVL